MSITFIGARIFWIACAVIAFMILVPVSISGFRDWQVCSKGTVVRAEVTSLPGALGFLKFRINGQIYDKHMRARRINPINVGDTIQLRYLQGYEGHILWPAENPIGGDIAAIIMLFIMGIAF